MKKLKYNEATKDLDIIEEISEDSTEERAELKNSTKEYIRQIVREEFSVNNKKRIADFIITIIPIAISLGLLIISYSQQTINKQQADINMRQFNLSKKPTFECIVEKEDLYDEERDWNIYQNWLSENGIMPFNKWLRQKFPEKNVPNWNTDKIKLFWNAYSTSDENTLAELTEGEYSEYRNEYRQYLSDNNYNSYISWKNSHVYERKYITLKNTGAHITNARIELYTFLEYRLYLGDSIVYSFAIDMNGYVFSSNWVGQYIAYSPHLESGMSDFEYEQDVLSDFYKTEYAEVEKLIAFLSSQKMGDAIGIDANKVNVFCVTAWPVYLSITYLDSEQQKQTDWYEYNTSTDCLYSVDTYESNIEIPDIKKTGLNDAYYEAKTLKTAETLGYQNAQCRPYFSENDCSYLEDAKQKMISDLKALIQESEEFRGLENSF